jgi:hypothetical protein
LSADNTPYMFDRNHYTKYGADVAVNKMLNNNIFKHFLEEAQVK